MTTSRTVTVTTTATRLDSASDETAPGASLQGTGHYGQSVIVYNAGSVTVYLGGSDVTSSNGLPVAATSYGPSFDLNVADTLYGRTASSTADVRVLETGI